MSRTRIADEHIEVPKAVSAISNMAHVRLVATARPPLASILVKQRLGGLNGAGATDDDGEIII